MEEKIENSIVFYKLKIDQIEKIKTNVVSSETKDIRLKIETKHWYGLSEPFLSKEKHKIQLEKSVIVEVLNEIQNKYKENIDKLIDMEIERRNNKC